MRKKSPVRNSKKHKKMNKALLAVLAVLFTGFLTCVIIGSYVSVSYTHLRAHET